nr:MAG TPA: hypothetical protein [Caudoviricetes sp.]
MQEECISCNFIFVNAFCLILISQLNSNINKCLKVLNLSGKDGQSAKEIIQKYIDKNAFNTGIYVGSINRGSQDGYICSATGNTYMAFIVFGYTYTSPQYYTYISGTWTP